MNKVSHSLYFFIIVFFLTLSFNKVIYSFAGKAQEYKAQKDSLNNYLVIMDSLSRTDYDSTIAVYPKLISLAKNTNDSLAVAKLDFYKAVSFYFKTNLDSTEYYLLKALPVLKSHKDTVYQIKCLNRLGNVTKHFNHYSKSFQYFSEALSLAKKIDDPRSAGITYINIGNLYIRLEERESAMQYLLNGLRNYEKINWKEGIAWTQYSLGSVYRGLGNYDKAIEYVNKAYEHYQFSFSHEQTNTLGLALCISQLGAINADKKEYRTALRYGLKAVELREAQDLKVAMATEYRRVGSYYFELKNYDKAYDYYMKSYNLKKKIGAYSQFSLINYDLANFYYHQNNKNKAIEYLLIGLKFAREQNIVSDLRNINEFLSKIYNELGNFKKALHYQTEYSNILEKYKSEKTDKRITFLEMEYELDKKSNENALLLERNKSQNLKIENQIYVRNLLITIVILVILFFLSLAIKYRDKKIANSEILNQRSELEKLNSDKDKLFSIISHDLKSPFVSLLGFSDLIKKEYNNLSDEDKTEIISSIDSTAKKIYTLLENLLEWSAIQLGTLEVSKKEFNLHDEIEKVISLSQIKSSEKEISIINEVEENSIVSTDPYIINTVIRNLINNSIKFTFNKGEIRIKSKTTPTYVQIIIQDSGVGMSDEQIKNLFEVQKTIKSKGTNNESGTGLGLILCKAYLEQINGAINAKSQLGKGTSFFITVPNK